MAVAAGAGQMILAVEVVVTEADEVIPAVVVADVATDNRPRCSRSKAPRATQQSRSLANNGPSTSPVCVGASAIRPAKLPSFHQQQRAMPVIVLLQTPAA